ncbi:hypothetical protein HMPREF9571_01673 [Cutibacterium acnes HL043PA2]|nr:hypothetical protein HMPREF9571_01673 [Cutibacterium acnes HL043PA2]
MNCHLHAFDGRKPSFTHRALPPPTDRSTVFAYPRIQDSRVIMLTERAAHHRLLPQPHEVPNSWLTVALEDYS